LPERAIFSFAIVSVVTFYLHRLYCPYGGNQRTTTSSLPECDVEQHKQPGRTDESERYAEYEYEYLRESEPQHPLVQLIDV